MSDVWDGLFETTSLSTDPAKPAPKAAPIAPAAKTEAPAEKPKRVSKKAKAETATPIPPAEPAADASIFFGSDDDSGDDAGIAAATAAAKTALAVTGGDDDDFDPFGDEDDVPPVPAPIAAPTPLPAPTAAPSATPAPVKKGRKTGSKKKTVTAEQFVGQLAQVEKGEPLADGTFPGTSGTQAPNGTVEPNDSAAAATSPETVSYEIDVLARAIARVILEEVVAILSGKGTRPA